MTNKCYICGRSDALQEHHIIPQAFGGEKGPTVYLCANDHQKAHQQAQSFEAKTGSKELLFPMDQWQRAKNIVGYIQLAMRKSKQNPNFNDPGRLPIVLTKQEISLLHLMKQDAGYTNLTKYITDLIRGFIQNRYPIPPSSRS